WLEWRRKIAPLEREESPTVSEAKGTVSSSAGERDALRKAIESERESIALYQAAEESTPDPHGKTMFKSLAREEENHLALVEEELEWLVKSRQQSTVHRFRPGGY
ncbi:MAG: ferritin family protein, partial [Dehalococcoidia bacterium]